MDCQDMFWNILKEDWTGRIYRCGYTHQYKIYILGDRGNEVFYRNTGSKSTEQRVMRKKFVEDQVASGGLVRMQ